MPVCFNMGVNMTPHQADVWQAYHQASEILADATDELLRARERRRRAGLVGSCAEQEAVVAGLLANYRAARAAMESL